MPFQDLPQELVERVLDEFRPLPRSKKTRKALLACALVNKSFSAHAQRLLISDIRLELEHSERIACLHSVLSSTPSLVRYVRSISIIFNRENLRQSASWFRLASIEPVLKLLQEHKAEPERMSIKNEGPSYYPYHRRFMFYSLDPLFRDAIQQFYAPNLTILHLSAVELQEEFVTNWPKTLQKLVLSYCTVPNNYANGTSTALQTFPKLEYLCLGNVDGLLWKIFWVQHSTSSPRNQIASKLKKVRFVYDSVSDLHVIWSLLTVGNLGSILEDLELWVQPSSICSPQLIQI